MGVGKEFQYRITTLNWNVRMKYSRAECILHSTRNDVTFRSLANWFQAKTNNCLVKLDFVFFSLSFSRQWCWVNVWLIAVIVACDWCSKYINIPKQCSRICLLTMAGYWQYLIFIVFWFKVNEYITLSPCVVPNHQHLNHIDSVSGGCCCCRCCYHYQQPIIIRLSSAFR